MRTHLTPIIALAVLTLAACPLGPKEEQPKDDAADEADSRPAAEPNGTETGEPKDPPSDGTGTETGAALTCEEQAKVFLDECMATK